MEKEEVVEKISWSIIPLVIALPFIGSATRMFTERAVSYLTDIGKMGAYHHFAAATVLIPFLIMVISMKIYPKLKLSPSNFAYLHAAAVISTFYGCGLWPAATFRRLLGSRYVDANGLAAKFLPSWWMVSKDAIKAFREPGPINPEWGPVVLYWWGFGVALWLLIVGLSIFVRYQWIDVDNLPYPYAQVALETIHTAREPSRPQTKKLIIGILVGFTVFFLTIMRMFFKWFPDVFGWLNTTTHDTDYVALKVDVVWPAIFKSVVGMTWISYNPLYIALAFFIPLNTLFSAAFFYIVYILIGTQIVWYMGYYTGIENLTAGQRTDMLRHVSPINVTGLIEYGLLPMTLVMAIVLNWRTVIAKPLRLALGTGTETEKQTERKEPIPYRTALILVIASGAVIVALLTVSGFPVDLSFIYVAVTLALYQLSVARVRGYAGPIPVGDRVAAVFFRWKYPNVTLSNVPQGFWLYGLSGHFSTDGEGILGEISLPIFETWRVGADLGANPRNLFKVMCVSAFIAPLFGLLGYVSVGSALGYAHTNALPISDYSTYGAPSYVYTRPALGQWPHIVAGALLAAFLSYMRFRFIWWPLDPVGAFIGLGGPGVKIGLGWVFIIAFIMKYVVLKVGGSKLYTDTAAPFATGFLVGTALICIFGLIVGSVIFFRPF